MMKQQKKKDILNQTELCKVLMTKLHDSINRSFTESTYYGIEIENKTQKINDLIRLRRELNELREMIELNQYM